LYGSGWEIYRGFEGAGAPACMTREVDQLLETVFASSKLGL
jgi:hypothetical protein